MLPETAGMPRLLVSAYSIAVLVMLAAGAYPSQAAFAFSYNILDEGSCSALPASAKARWDHGSGRCIIAGTLTLSTQDLLIVGQDVTLVVEGRITNQGVINNGFGATLIDKGKITNEGTITNMGNITLPSAGAFVNQGLYINSVHALLKSFGRITNEGTITNYANATIMSAGKMTNRADVGNAGYIENRGTAFMLENSTLSGAGTLRNTGNVMVYCGAKVSQALSVRAAIDRCDDPPAAVMGPELPSGEAWFTFYANATDDVRLARLEWDFDGDGKVDYQTPLVSKVSTMVNATHVYPSQGSYHPQVRAVDSAGQKSLWSKGTSLDIAPPNSASLAHNATLTVDSGAIAHFTLNATDADGDRLEYYVLSQPAHGLLTGSAPEMTYEPDDGYAGQDDFTFIASDGKDDSQVATVSITVKGADEQQAAVSQQVEENEPNSNPVAYGQTVEAREDSPASFRLAASDPDGDWLQYSILSDPLHGTLSGNAPDLTYTPEPEYFGQDSITFRASDSFGGSSTAIVSINVASVNDMPAAYDDSATTDQSKAVAIAVLENDEDIETEALTVVSTGNPQNGTSAINGDGTVTYTPNSGFSGSDYFTYTISDGQGGSATAGVSVTVNPIQQALEPVPVPPVPTPQPAPASSELYCGREISTFSNVIRGTEGRDTLIGTAGDDLILGLGGDDTIKGRGGDDCLIGGTGDDSIWGGDGDDVIYGNEGRDKLVGDSGNDREYGGKGNDSIWGGDGSDELHGESGDDKVVGDGGSDTVYGDEGDDRLWGGYGDDKLYGGSGNDKLVGDGGNDLLSGNEGDDNLYDDFGNDILDGGDGRDLGFDLIGDNEIVNCERR